MSSKLIANGQARHWVANKSEFKGSNLYALWNEGRTIYKVCSFGEHHPLFVYDANAEQWYENTTHASKTTSKHRTQTRPPVQNIIQLHANDMAYVVKYGAVGLIMAAEEQAEERARETRTERLVKMLAQSLNGTSMGGVK